MALVVVIYFWKERMINMSSKLILCDNLGNWGLKGVPMMSLTPGNVISENTYDKLYDALYKLYLYESVCTSPEKLVLIYDLVDELYESRVSDE